MIVEILILAAVAGFLFLRLREVLGRRTGHQNPADYFGASSPGEAAESAAEHDKVVAFPGRGAGQAPLTHDDISAVTDLEGPVGQTLVAAKEIEPEFDARRFVEGARSAYEIILMAFETGDKAALEPLLEPDVYESFAAAIDDRKAKSLSVDARFVGLRKADIEDARLDHATNAIDIDMRFEAEMIVAVRNADGDIVEGDPSVVRRMNDLWTFRRTLGTQDPSWTLAETGA